MKPDNQLSGLPATRREFLQGVGITFAIGASGVISACAMESDGENPVVAGAPGADEITPNAWVSIAIDDTITIQYGGTEMGQGSMTSVPLVLAEELDADWDNVRVETVAKHDPKWTQSESGKYWRELWRAVMGPGIEYMSESIC